MNNTELNRTHFARYTYGFALLIIIYRFFSFALVHQLQTPVLFENSLDYTYWLFHYLKIPQLLLYNKTTSILFDTWLFLSTLYCFIYAARYKLIVLLNAISWSCYAIFYNSFSCHHNYTIIGVMILPYAFMVKNEIKFNLVWGFYRDLNLYILADAFIFKAFINKNIFYTRIGSEIIKPNQSIYLLQTPGTWLTKIYSFFIQHPHLAYTGFILMVFMQMLCLIGFFTKKYDKYLFYIVIIFHVINYFFVDVMFLELLILNVTLLHKKNTAIEKYFRYNKNRV
ncbi:MAG: hypothetical protein IPJ81_04590 [Chitinophagaceae bacterium]|nr:hypothetical protein [Chitinophagaceae bacterium]